MDLPGACLTSQFPLCLSLEELIQTLLRHLDLRGETSPHRWKASVPGAWEKTMKNVV